mmetsp:Transcript_109810/g.212598  ORF Transcript_109810/g.212598 Transcript_109810/m.212598 type:complete len:87 (+) Transcript_109810:292-552(+)
MCAAMENGAGGGSKQCKGQGHCQRSLPLPCSPQPPQMAASGSPLSVVAATITTTADLRPQQISDALTGAEDCQLRIIAHRRCKQWQ